MSSISDSDYTRLWAELIRNAIARPRMYFNSLKELESIMRGHAMAFDQLGAGLGGQTFHGEFGNWLARLGLSACSGWAYAIQEKAEQEGSDAETLFIDFAREFLEERGV